MLEAAKNFNELGAKLEPSTDLVILGIVTVPTVVKTLDRRTEVAPETVTNEIVRATGSII